MSKLKRRTRVSYIEIPQFYSRKIDLLYKIMNVFSLSYHWLGMAFLGRYIRMTQPKCLNPCVARSRDNRCLVFYDAPQEADIHQHTVSCYSLSKTRRKFWIQISLFLIQNVQDGMMIMFTHSVSACGQDAKRYNWKLNELKPGLGIKRVTAV